MRTCGLAGAIVVSSLAASRGGLAQTPAAQFPAESPAAPKPAPAPPVATAPSAPASTPPAAPAPSAPAPATSTSSPVAAPPPSAVPPIVAPVPPTNPEPPRLQPDREPLDARPQPNWSIGGGIGFASDNPLSPAPSYLGAFERRLGERAWLIVGVSASRDANEVPRSQPGGGLSNTSSTTTVASAQLGLRYVLVQSVVDVSGELAAFGKYKNVGGSAPAMFNGGATRTRSLGLQAGIAAERALTEGLALRLTMRIARGSVESDTYWQADSLGVMMSSDTSGSSLALVAEPSLALYFYF